MNPNNGFRTAWWRIRLAIPASDRPLGKHELNLHDNVDAVMRTKEVW